MQLHWFQIGYCSPFSVRIHSIPTFWWMVLIGWFIQFRSLLSISDHLATQNWLNSTYKIQRCLAELQLDRVPNLDPDLSRARIINAELLHIYWTNAVKCLLWRRVFAIATLQISSWDSHLEIDINELKRHVSNLAVTSRTDSIDPFFLDVGCLLGQNSPTT